MKALKIVAVIVGVIILLIAGAIWYFSDKVTAEHLAEFIHKHPDKSAIYLVQNGEVLADVNSDRISPLASTVKIIVAIEYAEQAANGTIDPNMMVDTAELDKYYIPNTDGGAQEMWLAGMKKDSLLNGSKVRLEEVAKGMINYSSNANTEYLMDLLTLDSVNARLDKLGLTKHQKLYYFISALYATQGKTKEELKAMPLAEYTQQANTLHQKVKEGVNLKGELKDLSLDLQKIWSERLPGSTPKEYVSIMHKINSRTYFDSTTQHYIDLLMEGVLDNPKNREWLTHAGFKGGSTAFILTMALYATTKDGETTELAYFFNDLDTWDALLLQQNVNDFHLAILDKNLGKREEILKLINGK